MRLTGSIGQVVKSCCGFLAYLKEQDLGADFDVLGDCEKRIQRQARTVKD